MKKLLILIICLVTIIFKLQAQEKKIVDLYFLNKDFNVKLSRWLDFYHLKIKDFRYENTVDFSLEEDSASIYKKTFESEQQNYDPILKDYSPSKKRYIDLLSAKGVYSDNISNRYYYGGGDDCQEIYYVDLETKHNKIIKWNGSTQDTEDIFWINDNEFILVSKDASTGTVIYIIEIYSIIENSIIKVQTYLLSAEDHLFYTQSYFQDIVLTKRNIKIDY